jgi:hypothetical protein
MREQQANWDTLARSRTDSLRLLLRLLLPGPMAQLALPGLALRSVGRRFVLLDASICLLPRRARICTR